MTAKDRAKVMHLLHEIFPNWDGSLNAALQADSLLTLEIAFGIEEIFNITLNDEGLSDCGTPKQFLKWIDKQVQNNAKQSRH